MRYEFMFPEELRNALDRNIPAVMTLGVTEFHADHLVFGVDTILPQRTLELLEKEKQEDMILFPPFWFGAASYAVEKPERNGSIHIPSETLNVFARDFFTSMLRVGFRNMHCFYVHQSENFIQGMPTDLAFKLGARQAIFAFLEKELGEGWWGRDESSDYYEKHFSNGGDPFNWIQIHPLKSPRLQKLWHSDHAGINETSHMMALCPEGVNMKKPLNYWFTKEAAKASRERGLEMTSQELEDIRKTLFPEEKRA